MLPVYPFVGLLVKTNVRHFFTTHQPCYVAQLMYVNGVYIFMMFVTLLLPLVNCFEISLNVISSNVHKTVVLYKAVQSFCSDIVAQNVNVISLPTCKVLCFKKHHRVSPVKCQKHPHWQLHHQQNYIHHQYYHHYHHHYHHYHYYHHHLQFQHHHHHHYHHHRHHRHYQ